MAEIRWTEEALRWLRDIYDYIAANNPDAVQKVVSGIYEKAQVLVQFPEIGHKYRSEAEGEIRGIPGTPYWFLRQPRLPMAAGAEGNSRVGPPAVQPYRAPLRGPACALLIPDPVSSLSP